MRWNLDREIQFSERWEYMPISPKDFAATQWLLLDEPNQHIRRGETGLSSMFSLVQLSLDDGDQVFGLTEAFKHVLPELPNLPNQKEGRLLNLCEEIVEFAFTDSSSLDRMAEIGQLFAGPLRVDPSLKDIDPVPIRKDPHSVDLCPQ